MEDFAASALPKLIFDRNELFHIISEKKIQLVLRCVALGLSPLGRRREILERILLHIGKPQSDGLIPNIHLNPAPLSQNHLRMKVTSAADVLHGEPLRMIISYLTIRDQLRFSLVHKDLYNSDELLSCCNFDLIPEKYWPCVFDHLCSRRTKLRELIIRLGRSEYDNILGILFENCDIGNLRKLTVYSYSQHHFGDVFTHLMKQQRKQVTGFWHKRKFDQPFLSYLKKESLVDVHIPISFSEENMPNVAILQYCTNLVNLEVFFCGVEVNLTSFKRTTLQMFSVVEKLSSLKKFKWLICKTIIFHPRVSCIFKSNSLEHLDLSSTSKGIEFTDIICPSLVRLTYKGGLYGCIPNTDAIKSLPAGCEVNNGGYFD